MSTSESVQSVNHTRTERRSHSCSELRLSDVGQRVTLGGWVYRKRDQKHQVFLDLRDHYGVTQLVFDGDRPGPLETARNVRPESVVFVSGEVVERAAKNDKIPTGQVEVRVETIEVDSPCEDLSKLLPVAIPKGSNDRDNEQRRMEFRFLDLRRERMHRNIVARDQIIRFMREHMAAEGFIEVQTPILTNSSPEGARDYLVPSRLHPGQFYALPQAPQQWKQLLMASGFDRYFQIAACFRDEDARADRSPGEFYQLDMEMAFVGQEDVFGVIERLYKRLADEIEIPGVPRKRLLQYPFPRLKYWDAIDRFGCDKPDLRYGLELEDVSAHVKGTEFGLFKDALAAGGHVKALRIPGGAKEGKGWIRKLEKWVKGQGYGGLPHLIQKDGAADGSLKKALSADEAQAIFTQLGCEDDDVVAFGCGDRLAAAKVLGDVRVHVAEERELADPDELGFSFIVDYPFYEWDPDKNDGAGGIEFSHNPFSMPQGGMQALEGEPLDVLAYQYDIVCNGIELSSGAIRNHRPDIMYRAFETVGYSKEQVDREFGHMINAFRYGCPPHGGMAPGVERTIMIFLNEPNIREVVAFPKNQHCQDLLVNCPSPVSQAQLDELHLQINLPPAKEQAQG